MNTKRSARPVHHPRPRRHRTLGHPVSPPPVTRRHGPVSSGDPAPLSALPPHRRDRDETRIARLIVWTLGEEHHPARLAAARTVAEEMARPHRPPTVRIMDHLTEAQARDVVLHALRGVCHRPGLLARLWALLSVLLGGGKNPSTTSL
ncbi:MAG: hypothetical protein V4726_01015 [Verrucomicrobiota bacterium]